MSAGPSPPRDASTPVVPNCSRQTTRRGDPVGATPQRRHDRESPPLVASPRRAGVRRCGYCVRSGIGCCFRRPADTCRMLSKHNAVVLRPHARNSNHPSELGEARAAIGGSARKRRSIAREVRIRPSALGGLGTPWQPGGCSAHGQDHSTSAPRGTRIARSGSPEGNEDHIGFANRASRVLDLSTRGVDPDQQWLCVARGERPAWRCGEHRSAKAEPPSTDPCMRAHRFSRAGQSCGDTVTTRRSQHTIPSPHIRRRAPTPKSYTLPTTSSFEPWQTARPGSRPTRPGAIRLRPQAASRVPGPSTSRSLSCSRSQPSRRRRRTRPRDISWTSLHSKVRPRGDRPHGRGGLGGG